MSLPHDAGQFGEDSSGSGADLASTGDGADGGAGQQLPLTCPVEQVRKRDPLTPAAALFIALHVQDSLAPHGPRRGAFFCLFQRRVAGESDCGAQLNAAVGWEAICLAGQPVDGSASEVLLKVLAAAQASTDARL